MQHHVVEAVLRAFSGFRAGQPSPTVAGLVVVPLRSRGGREPTVLQTAFASPGRRRSRAVASLAWSELEPAQPRWLRASNRGPRAVIVDAGTVLDGGMSRRALPITAVISAGAHATVAAEPIAARWWDEGRLHWAGRLPPLWGALLLQAWLGCARDAAMARTALWSGPEPPLGGAPMDDSVDGVVSGWTLWAGDEMLAGWLGLRGRAPRQAGGRAAARVTEAADLGRALSEGRLEAHILEPGPQIHDVAILPSGMGLVDRVVGAASRAERRSTRTGIDGGAANPHSCPSEPARRARRR